MGTATPSTAKFCLRYLESVKEQMDSKGQLEKIKLYEMQKRQKFYPESYP